MTGKAIRLQPISNARVRLEPLTSEPPLIRLAGVVRQIGEPGDQGDPGASAYQVAVANGFVGTEAAWLASLKGEPGDPGTDGDDGDPGASAYQVAVANGFVGTEAAWLASLKGEPGDPGTDGDDGDPGPSAYQVAVANGFVGTEAAWLASLKGDPGDPGDLSAYAPKASPEFTGTPLAPTPAAATNSNQIATTAFVQAVVAALVNGAPGALDQLNELAAALGNDANFAASMATALAGKQPLDATLTALAGLAGGADKLPYFTGTDVLAQATLTSFMRSLLDDADAATARATLGLVPGTDVQAYDADLAAIAALTTTAYGRALLTLANAAAFTALGNTFTSALKGLVPPSGGGTTNFLRADGVFAAPPAGGGSADEFMYLNADYNLTNTTSTQKLFNSTTNGRFTLPTGIYEFRGLIYLTAMSATSGNLNFDLLGAGTATISGFAAAAYGRDGAFLDSSGGAAITGNYQRSAIFSRPVQAGTGVEAWFKLDGIFKLTGAGTVIPSVLLDNAAPAVVKQTSYIALRRLADSTTYASGSAD